MSINLSAKEIRTLHALVEGKRQQYGRIGDQFSLGIIEYCRTLNALAKKLKDFR
jgi:hypothetical protein